MAAIFPDGLDTLVCPTSSSKLNEVPHAELHCSESDQIGAIQARVGVTGSAVPTTIDYELHNVEHGHNHDGVNSRLLAGLSGSSIAFESQDVELTPTAVRVNFSGSGVSGSVSGNDVTYVIPGHEHRHLQHLVSCGPFEDFVTSSMFHQLIYPSGTIRLMPTASTWWKDVGMSGKLFETQWIRNSRMQATKVVYRVYEINGSTVKTTAVDLITYDGPFETSRTRTIT